MYLSIYTYVPKTIPRWPNMPPEWPQLLYVFQTYKHREFITVLRIIFDKLRNSECFLWACKFFFDNNSSWSICGRYKRRGHRHVKRIAFWAFFKVLSLGPILGKQHREATWRREGRFAPTNFGHMPASQTANNSHSLRSEPSTGRRIVEHSHMYEHIRKKGGIRSTISKSFAKAPHDGPRWPQMVVRCSTLAQKGLTQTQDGCEKVQDSPRWRQRPQNNTQWPQKPPQSALNSRIFQTP